jgi:hypothetical protein
MQSALLWALGRECLGIRPARPLKSLFIQAENDDGDLFEMREGVIAGIELSDQEALTACNSILVAREDRRTGVHFFREVVRPLLSKHPCDFLWIDPALAYLGGEASGQKDVGSFLRNNLNPCVREFRCGVVVVTHTNKPPVGREKPNWGGSEFAYLGTGSIEWANWPRAIIAIRALGSHKVFELRAAKRGSKLGWKEPDGSPCYSKLIAHSKEPGVICWREVDPGEIETGGRPTKADEDEIFHLLPGEGLKASEWFKAAEEEYDISKSTWNRIRRALAKQKRVLRSKVSGKWQPIQKP